MDGGRGQHIGGPDHIHRFHHRQFVVVDVLGPDVTDPLLSIQIVLRNLFQCGRSRLIGLDLMSIMLLLLRIGVENDKYQNRCHENDISGDDPGFLHKRSPL